MLAAMRGIIVVGVLALAACAPAPSNGAANPALWTVSDQDSRITLFGTVHVLAPGTKWRTRPFDAALAQADVIYLETATDEAAIQDLVAAQGYLPAGQRLSSRLDGEGQARFARVLDQVGLAREEIERQRPWLAGLQIALAFMVQEEGVEPGAGVETEIEAYAVKRKIPMRYFETVGEQIGLLSSLPETTQIAALLATLRQIEEDPASSKALFDHWRHGETEALGALTKSQIDEAPGLYEPLIVARNERWADAIAAMMAGEGEVLVAVGAAHLAGVDSVQSLLVAKGFKVEGPPWGGGPSPQ